MYKTKADIKKHNDKLMSLNSIVDKKNLARSCGKMNESVSGRVFAVGGEKGGMTRTSTATAFGLYDFIVNGKNVKFCDFDPQMHMSHRDNRLDIPANKGGVNSVNMFFSYIGGMSKDIDSIEAFPAYSLEEEKIYEDAVNLAEKLGTTPGDKMEIIIGHKAIDNAALACGKEYGTQKNMLPAVTKAIRELAKDSDVIFDLPSASTNSFPCNIGLSVCDHLVVPVNNIESAESQPDFITRTFNETFPRFGASRNGILGNKPTLSIIRTNVDTRLCARPCMPILKELDGYVYEMIKDKSAVDPIHAIYLKNLPNVTLSNVIRHTINAEYTPFDSFKGDAPRDPNVFLDAFKELTRKVEDITTPSFFDKWNPSTMTTLSSAIKHLARVSKEKRSPK